MPPRHYVRAGIYVERAEVNEETVAVLAKTHGGRVRQPPRGVRGRPEWVIPSDDGDLVIPAGGVAVLASGGVIDGYSDPLEFEYDYATVR